MSAYQGIGPLFDRGELGRHFKHAEDICANRHKGNEQSVAANKRVDKNVHRQRILRLFRNAAQWTCDELEVLLDLPHQSASARISELKRDGLIVKVGTRPTRSGCSASVYQAT